MMRNWEAIYECQDERDAERMRKRMALAAESLLMSKTFSCSRSHIGGPVHPKMA